MIPTQPFGSTGHLSTRVIFGAAALWGVSEEEGERALELIVMHGINHIDTAAMYGRSERRVGAWMPRHRDRFFVATKTAERAYEKARDQIRHSLERLQTDHVDLIQLHNLVDEAEWETALGPGGALQAAVEARAQGRARFIGVTGHGVTVAAMHLRSLERFPFDSVLLPYSYVMMRDPQYAADFEALAKVCVQRGVAMQTIKGVTVGPWNDKEHTSGTWYEPLTEQEDIDRAVHYVLGRPGAFLNTAADLTLLPSILDAAGRFAGAPSENEMRDLAARRSMAPLFT
ncbi:MAG: aldo/keto reductase [Candidatus Omnitrophota bacterium]|nr:aldo/keto reductase [Candidatus Omnitrophota bacterium]